MAQHFLLSAAARSLNPGKVMRMSDRGAENVFVRLRWPQTDGKPVCPRCECQICYDCRRATDQPRWRCKACGSDFSVTSDALFAWHNRGPASHRQPDHAMHLVAIAGAAQVFAPGCFLRVTNEIRSGNMVMVPKFAATQAGEIGFRAIGATRRLMDFCKAVSEISNPLRRIRKIAISFEVSILPSASRKASWYPRVNSRDVKY